ncbi:MAG: tyrosine-type recombinase/integrase [Amphritea sp.]
MSAPRKTKLTNVPNLYAKRDKRTGRLSIQYRDIRPNAAKEWHGMGSDLQIAEFQARQLNALIAQEIIDKQAAEILSGNSKFSGMTVGKMLDEYESILDERQAANEIKPATVKQRKSQARVIRQRFASLPLLQLDTVTISNLLREYQKADKAAWAKVLRAMLKDMFKEAMNRGFFPADKPNPAHVATAPRMEVKRARLTLEFFLRVLEWAKENQRPQYWKAYVFTLLTAQRLSDVGATRFKDVVEEEGIEFFRVEQSKGRHGSKLLIPTSLRLECVGFSIKEIVKLCRDSVASPFIFHHSKVIGGKVKVGDPIDHKRISAKFTQAVKAVQEDWGKYNNPTFHELRSLAEREHRKQGINTQHLLGHKNQSTTEIYADARGHEFIKIALKG